MKSINMKKEEIEKLIEDKIRESEAFRRWRKFDSVTDVFSPITSNSTQIGFFGKSKISKPTVTGSKGANAALTSLMLALSNLGLVTDGTS